MIHANQNMQAENTSVAFKSCKVACIGAGKMLGALIAGMIKGGYDPQHIMATRRDKTALQALSQRFGIHVSDDNTAAASWADVIILGVKPVQHAAVLSDIAQACRDKYIISIMAGISTEQLQSSLIKATSNGLHDWHIMRAMPNLPCQLAHGVTGLFPGASVSAAEQEWTERLFSTLGAVLWLDKEAKMHPLTVISGSGPAYFFLLQEYLINFAIAQGFSQKEAEMLVERTAAGAGLMSEQSSYSPQALRNMISSPGGVTEKVVQSLKKHQLDQIWNQALTLGCLHSQDMD